MRFEQAFYTRGEELLDEKRGLGIVAASNRDESFLSCCRRIGSDFKTEPHQKVSEFVLYEDSIGKFVGVSVSPSYEQDGGNRNKLVHIFVPEQASGRAEDYYLSYPFRSTVEKGELLEEVEIRPDLGEEDFDSLLGKYGMDEEKLAVFLTRIFPILFRENSRLYLVTDNRRDEDRGLSRTAREMTWLASQLAPEEQDSLSYRKNLTYSVYSAVNSHLGKLIYMTEEEWEKMECSRGDVCFFPDRPVREEVPELYRELAGRLRDSRRAYLDFMKELRDQWEEDDFSTQGLDFQFFCWRLHKGYAAEKDEIPMEITNLLDFAIRGKKYRRLLYECLLSLKGWATEDLRIIWNAVIAPQLEKPSEYEEENFLAAAEKVLFLFPQEGLKGEYRDAMKKLPQRIRGQIQQDLYHRADSGIWAELEGISSAQECREFFAFYEDLQEDEDFLLQFQDVALRYYFELNKEDRERFHSAFSRFPGAKREWEEKVEGHIRGQLRGEQDPDRFVNLICQEFGRMEGEYFLLYFEEFVEKCRSQGSQWDDRAREKLKAVGNSFAEGRILSGEVLEKYSALQKEYNGLIRQWERERLLNKWKHSSLEELSGSRLEKEPREIREFWCDQVLERLEREALTPESTKKLLDQLCWLAEAPGKCRVLVGKLQEKLYELLDGKEEQLFGREGFRQYWQLELYGEALRSEGRGGARLVQWENLERLYQNSPRFLRNLTKVILEDAGNAGKPSQKESVWTLKVFDHICRVAVPVQAQDYPQVCELLEKAQKGLGACPERLERLKAECKKAEPAYIVWSREELKKMRVELQTDLERFQKMEGELGKAKGDLGKAMKEIARLYELLSDHEERLGRLEAMGGKGKKRYSNSEYFEN